MTSVDFITRAKELVAQEADTISVAIQPVWFGYVLGDMKGIFIITSPENQDMYEVTFNRAKAEIYVDRYCKISNTAYEAYPSIQAL